MRHLSPEAQAEHAVAAELELLSGLLLGTSGWGLREWRKALAPLPPNERRVVVLRLIHGMEWLAVGERMGFGRGRGPQVFDKAVRRLRPFLQAGAA